MDERVQNVPLWVTSFSISLRQVPLLNWYSGTVWTNPKRFSESKRAAHLPFSYTDTWFILPSAILWCWKTSSHFLMEKKKPKPKPASQTRNKLNEIRLMWGNTKSYPGKKMKSCAVDCKSSHACWEWTLTATSCVGLFLFVIFEQSGAAQPIVWAEEQHRKVAWAARSALSPPLNSWKSCQTPFPAQTQPSNGFVSAFIDGLGCVHSWQTTQGTFFGSSSFYQNISPHL